VGSWARSDAGRMLGRAQAGLVHRKKMDLSRRVQMVCSILIGRQGVEGTGSKLYFDAGALLAKLNVTLHPSATAPKIFLIGRSQP
jgi:hypothetical protein